jgi:hypothetical protein
MIDYVAYGFNVALLLGLIVALACRSLGVLGLCAVFALVVVVLGAFSLGVKNAQPKKPTSVSSSSNPNSGKTPTNSASNSTFNQSKSAFKSVDLLSLPASMSAETLSWAPFQQVQTHTQPNVYNRQYSVFAQPQLEMTSADKAADHIRAYNAQRATQFSSQQPFFIQETQGETRPDAYMTRRPPGPNMYDPRDPRDLVNYNQGQSAQPHAQQFQQAQFQHAQQVQQIVQPIQHRAAAIVSSQDPTALDNPMNSLSYLSGR